MATPTNGRQKGPFAANVVGYIRQHLWPSSLNLSNFVAIGRGPYTSAQDICGLLNFTPVRLGAMSLRQPGIPNAVNKMFVTECPLRSRPPLFGVVDAVPGEQ